MFLILLEKLLKKLHLQKKDDAPLLKGAWRYITKSAVNNFNERYEHLNKSEKDVLSVLMSGDNHKVEYLEDIKNENIKLIDSLLESDVDKMNHDVLIDFKSKVEGIGSVSIKRNR